VCGSNETYIRVWRSRESVVVIIFGIVGVDLACTSWSIVTLMLHHHGKLLLHHPHGKLLLHHPYDVPQMVNFYCCRSIWVEKSVAEVKEEGWVRENSSWDSYQPSLLCHKSNLYSYLPQPSFSNLLPDLKLGYCIQLASIGVWTWWTLWLYMTLKQSW